MDIMCSGLNWEQALYGYYVFRIQLALSIIWILCVQDWTGSIAVYGYYVFSIELEVQKYMDIMCSGLDWEQALYGWRKNLKMYSILVVLYAGKQTPLKRL